MTDHVDTKHRLREIASASDFRILLDACMLSDEEKRIADMIYRQDKTLSYIADILGYHEGTIKRKHKEINQKLRKLI